jgi:DeoR/GlpR family transcriptional regulator of sugar metabolism
MLAPQRHATVDHTKWGTAGISSIAAPSAADVVVTDSALHREARETLADSVGELLLAEPRR